MKKRSYRSLRTWLAARKKVIGASETPAIVGEGYAGSGAWSVWYSKVYGDELEETLDPDTVKRLRRGRFAEEFILKMFEAETEIQVTPGGMTIRYHPDYPWIGATCDGIAQGITPVEAKLFDRSQSPEWRDGDSPVKHQIQLQQQMQVTGADKGYLVGWDGSSNLQIREYERDDRFWDAVMPRLIEFWECVKSQRPPGIDWPSIATKRALATLHPKDNAKGIMLPKNTSTFADALDAAKRVQKNTKEVIAELENKLRAVLGDAAYGLIGDGTAVTLKTQSRKNTVPELHDSVREQLIAQCGTENQAGAEAMLQLLQESGWLPPSTFRVLRRTKNIPANLTVENIETDLSYITGDLDGEHRTEPTEPARIGSIATQSDQEEPGDDAGGVAETPNAGTVPPGNDDDHPPEPGTG
ncbi:hypothetical protein CMI37_15000 [Candidatus Pacearchaeota archaeon]|nr:hypothetical protein [Candidatus Pacearchaeota archaeon]|tara:strand:+ start:281 stop:1516 length:1236 start_codon:yes stop_codon:yes gene_type:complete